MYTVCTISNHVKLLKDIANHTDFHYNVQQTSSKSMDWSKVHAHKSK